MSDLQYPIGKLEVDPDVTPKKRARWIQEIADAPHAFRQAVAGLSDAQLDMPYRPGGWTVRQVVHHMPDAHVHCHVRFRLALTSDEPAVPGYDPARWAELPDARAAAVEPSLALLDALHARWLALLRAMQPADFARTYRRPDGQIHSLDRALQTYAWHGRHHAAHITTLRARMGWRAV